ncbi:MAG TPA: hypothetical protein VK598_00730, partial [Nitrospiraceae bacterium]|nr:hypothetical protein [Nitrospiraceae bacterium]
GRWRGIQTTPRRASAPAPATRIALRIMNQLSGGKVAAGPLWGPYHTARAHARQDFWPLPHDPAGWLVVKWMIGLSRLR